MGKQRLVLLVCGLFACVPVWAHGDIHHRMQRLEHDIARNPNNLDLRVRRGEMLLIARHGQDAYVEFSRILELAPQRFDLFYQLAKSQLLLKQFDAAKASVEVFLQKADNDASRMRGFLLTGEILAAGENWQDAAQAYQKVIELSDPLEPDSVLLAANAFRQAGKIDQSIDVLNAGINRLGPLQTLDDQALELEMLSGRHEAALARVDRMLSSKQRLPFLLYQKGQILDRLSRRDEAKQTYQLALAAIATLPPAKQKTQPVESLKATLQQAALP